MNLFSLKQLRRSAALAIDKTPVLEIEDGRTRGTTSVAHRCRGPLPSQVKSLDPAGVPRYRADPGAPRRTLAVQAPAQGRYPRGSGRPGFHRPGLAVRGLARAWSPSLPPTRIVLTLLSQEPISRNRKARTGVPLDRVQPAAMPGLRPRGAEGDVNPMRQTTVDLFARAFGGCRDRVGGRSPSPAQ